MIGEMRDRETADIAIEASLTGHVVFSTIHTNSAVETVIRLLDLGCDPFNFSDAMLGYWPCAFANVSVMSAKNRISRQDEYNELRIGYGANDWADLQTEYSSSLCFYRGRGCSSCGQTGFKGRLPLHELMVGSEPIRELIAGRARTVEMLEVARQEGMTTLVQDGIRKVLQGLTTYKQVRAVAIK